MSKGTEYLHGIVNGTEKFKGITSLCSSNELVLKAAMEYARDNDDFVLIEATANQVNQYGGYTGMKPVDFKNHVTSLAWQIGLNPDKIILGGDHLGPVAFKDRDGEEAMREAEGLIEAFVEAGFEKIHIDTSMRLSGDPTDQQLDNGVIAARGARLCRKAEQTFEKTFGKQSELMYVVGSEVPIPGGAQAGGETFSVTLPEDLEKTYAAFKCAFEAAGLSAAFERVIAIVVQPGVEFGDDSVSAYDREKAYELTKSLARYPRMVFEGHSTDYQTRKALTEMVRDGIRILKVGPELTFALREGLFALQSIARIMKLNISFEETLENLMLARPEHWKNYFTGNDAQIAIKRKYSYSDRWRYYANQKALVQAVEELFDGLDNVGIPLTLLSQYMPVQYGRVREGVLTCKSEELVKDKVKEVFAKYRSASQG